MSQLSKEALDTMMDQTPEDIGDYIKVGMSTCGIAAGADEVYESFITEIERRNLPVKVMKCGCIGMCYAEPMAEVKINGLPIVFYGRLTPDVAVEIIEKHVRSGRLVNDYIFNFKFKA